MPGRTRPEAFRAFIEPIQAAVACLGTAKVVPSPGGTGSRADVDHTWTLNGIPGGMVFPGGYCFKASMKYRFIEHEGGYRVTTLEYIYSLSLTDREVWAIHWHPVGSSHERRTHLHTEIAGAGDIHAHRPMPRITFEDAVEWVIEAGIKPARDDWRDILTHGRDVHIQHRSWHGNEPSEPPKDRVTR